MDTRWTAWGTTVRVEVTEPAAAPSAGRVVAGVVARAERAASTEFPGARVHRVTRAAGRPVRLRAPLDDLVAVAMTAARESAGAVDPTVGSVTLAVRAAEASRPASGWWRSAGRRGTFPVCAAFPVERPRAAIGWRTVDWTDRSVAVPVGGCLDLTATAKPRTAQRAADRVAALFGIGVLVEIGGDVATAGPAPRGGWSIAPQHAGGAVARLGAGMSIASVRSAGIVDPLTGRRVAGPWAALAVIGPDLVAAKTAAVGALVRGGDTHAYLAERGLRGMFRPAAAPLLVTV